MAFGEMNIFEVTMLVAFGSGWPLAVCKTLRTKKVEGKSFKFLVLIFIGYVSGTIFKLTTNPDAVLALYIFNGCMVFTEIVLAVTDSKRLRKKLSGVIIVLCRLSY